MNYFIISNNSLLINTNSTILQQFKIEYKKIIANNFNNTKNLIAKETIGFLYNSKFN